jgi:ATP-binding cassette, subfamily B, multidrug efflux pump
MKHLSYLNKYFIKYQKYLISGTIFIFISNFFGVVPAQLVRYALDLVKENLDMYFLYQGSDLQPNMYEVIASSVFFYGILILIMALLKGFFLFLVRQTLIVMSRHVEYDLKNEIYAHYQTLPLAFYRRNNTGDMMARISEDVGKVRMYIGPSLMYGLNLISVFILVLSYMFSINAKLTWFVLLPLPVLSLSIYLVNNLIIKKSEQIQAQLSQISTFVQEAFSGIRVLKAFVKEEDSTHDFERQATLYREKSLSLVQVDSLFTPLVAMLVGLSVVLVVYVGGQEVMAGRLTSGNIAEFILYVYMLTWPVTALGWTTSQIQRAAASQQRINEFLQEKTTLTSTKNIQQDMRGEVAFENISFVYPDTGVKALENFSLHIQSGQSVGILGSTGSGKSTLANLLCRMYDPTEGQIKVDGVPLPDWQLSSLRGQIGYVPQDVFLFSDSISQNVRFGQQSMDQETIAEATRKAELYHNIVEFPDGFNTILGERGITLSGGQKQRLSIARAIARNPKMMILDDCLSAVDTHTENAILENLQTLMQNRTTLIISHRVSSVKLADHILVLHEGRVVEQGSHEKLMNLGGTYRELYDKQLQAEEIA